MTSYKLFIRGISQEKDLVLRGNMDTCAFMKNTSEHMRHLMITNFQELYDHIKFLIERKSDLHTYLVTVTFVLISINCFYC